MNIKWILSMSFPNFKNQRIIWFSLLDGEICFVILLDDNMYCLEFREAFRWNIKHNDQWFWLIIHEIGDFFIWPIRFIFCYTKIENKIKYQIISRWIYEIHIYELLHLLWIYIYIFMMNRIEFLHYHKLILYFLMKKFII